MSEPLLIAGEIVAWRAWGVRLHLGKIVELEDGLKAPLPMLYSLNETLWPSDDWLLAKCGDGRREHTPPGKGCTCGVYAARDRDHLDLLNYADYGWSLKVIGEVGLAGDVVPGERGYRAEKARPLRLLVPYEHWELVRPLAAAYRVPVELDYILGPLEVPR